MLNKTYRILGILIIMMSTHLSAIIINNGTSSLSGNDGWLFDYTSTDNGDGAIIYNNTAYQVDFSFDVGDTTEAYYILLATDLDEDDNYLEHSDVWEQVESSTYNGSGESLAETVRYYEGINDINSTYSKDGQPFKFYIRRRAVSGYQDTLSLSGEFEWRLEPPSSPGTPNLDTDHDTGTSDSDNETQLTDLDFTVTSLIVSGNDYQVALVEADDNHTWQNSSASQLTPLEITTDNTMTLANDDFSDGYWYLRAVLINPHGCISTSGELTLLVDTQAPNPPNILDLKTTSDSGSNTSDNKTNDQTPTFTISPSSGNILGDDVSRVYFSGTVVTLTDSIIYPGCYWCGYADDDITVQIGELDIDNEYQVYAKFIDDAGNVSSSSDSLTFTLDTTEPTTPAKPDLESSDDTGFSTSDNLTNQGTLTDDIQITIGSLTDSDIDSVYLVMDNTDTLGRIELGVGNTSYTFTVNGLTEDDHTFKALVTDDTGNESADSQGLSVTIDTTASGRPTLDLKTSSDLGRLNDDDLTNDDTPTMTVGNLSASDSVIFYDNGSSIQSSLVDAASMDIDLNQLENGSHPLTVKAEDPAGNFSLTSTPTVNVRIDTDAPSQPDGPDLKDASDTGHANNDEYTSDTTPEFTIGSVTATIDSIVLNIAGQTIGQVPTGNSIDITVPLSISPDGNYAVYATKIDSAGNSTDGSSLTITIDTADPSTPAAPDLTNATDTGQENDDNKTNDMRPVFTVSTVSIGDSLYLKFLDSSGDTTIYARSKAEADPETMTAGSDVAEGTHNVWVMAFDQAGNQTEGSILSSVEIDTTPPAQISSTPDLQDSDDTGFLDDDNLTSDRTPAFNITNVTDADSILLYFDNTVVASSMVPGGATDVVLTPSQQNAGTYSKQVKVKRIDVVGNTSVASDSVNLRIDTDNPTTPSLSSLLPADDSGFLDNDGYTSDDTPSLIVTNVEGVDSIIVTLDGASNDYTRRAIVSQAGTDTLTTVTTLADDVYQLTAVAKDSAGNSSGTSGILRVTIDTEPTDPSLTNLSIDLADASDTGTENDDDLTGDLTPTFQITNATVSDSLYIVAEDASSDTDVVDGEIASATTVSMTSQNLTTLTNITYADGDFTFNVFSKDSAGNIPDSGLWPSITVELDATPPVAGGIAVDLLGTDDSGRDSTDNLTNELQPTFRISGITDQDSVYLVAGTDTVTRDIASASTINLTPDSNLPENPSLSIKALARDYAGNLSAASTILSVETDTTAPTQPNNADLDSGYDTGFYSDDDLTNSDFLGFVITGLVNGDSITFYVDDTQKSFVALGGYSAPNASSGEVGLLHAPSATGLLGIKSTVTDSAGNTSAFSGEMVVKLDQTPPGQTDKPDLVDASDTGTNNSDDETNDQTPTFLIGNVTSGDSIFIAIEKDGDTDTTGRGFASGNTIEITMEDMTTDGVTDDEGIFTFKSVARDSAGNQSQVSQVLVVTVDVTSPVPPTVDLSGTSDSGRDSTDNLTNELQPMFRISGITDQDSVYLVAGTDTVTRDIASASTINLTPDSNLPENPSLSIKALARDYAGNLSAASTILSVETDTTAPTQPNNADLDSGYDTGFYSDDDLTNSDFLGFVITGLVNGDSITFYVDDTQKSFVALGGYSAPNASSGEVGLLHAPSATGLLGIKSTVTDSAGNTSAFSGEMVVKLDQTPPGQTDKPDLVDASDTGNLNDDDYTSDLTPEFSIADVISGDSVFVIISDGSESDTTGKDFATNDTIQITLSNLTSDNISADDGVFSFTAFAVDSAGNASATVSSALSVTIDTTAPSAPIITLRSEDDSGVLNDDQLTNVMNPQFNAWNADGEDSLYIAAGSDTVFRGVPDENPDVVSTDSTTEGTISYTALLRDKAGNLSSVSTAYPVVIDTTRPGTPSLPDLLSASDAGFDDEDNITNETLPSFILTGLSGTIDSALIYFDGSVVGSQWISQPSTDTLQIDQQSFNSVEIFGVSVGAIDSAGNVSLISDTLTIKIDTELPTTSDPDLIPASDLGESSSDDITSDNTPTILLSSLEPGSINKLYRIAPGPPADTVMVQVDTVAAGEDTLSLTPSSPLTDDTYTVYSTTEDTAGNVVESGDLINLVIDTQEPSAVISLEDYLVRLEDLSDTVRVHFSEGMSDPPRISVRFAGGSVQDTSDMSSEFDSVWFFLLDIPDSNDGTATISITATDNASNELDSLNIVGRTLLKIDNTDPVFSSITPDTGAFVNYTEVAYTISEHANNPTRLDSASFIWTPTGPGSVIQADLETFELDVGAHALGTLTNDPQLEDGELYTLSITSQDSAGNLGLTVIDSVTYDTTGPTVDSLVYSKNPAMPGDTVEVKAYFNEIVPTAPSFVTSWPGLGAGGPFSMDSTLNGEMLVWLTEVEVPGISVSGKVDVTPTALDRATNPIDSLGGMVSDLFDTTWYIDVDAPTCSLTYANIDQSTLTNLGKGGDEVQITARFNEQAKGYSDAIPRLTIIFTDTSDHSIEDTPFTASSNGDTTWTYSFDLPSDSSYTGFMTVRLAAYDLAGNLVEDVVDTNVFEIDNIPPSLFTTGTVTPMGTLPKAGWFNQRTDSVAVLVPIDSEDPSLFQGKLQIRMQIDGVPASETDVGMPVTLTNISQDNTVDLMRDTVSTAFDPADFVEGVSLISWAELYDLAGNVTEGSSSTDTLVVDTIPPVMGSWTGGIVVDADTVISSDSLSAIWTGFTENIPAGESGINYYDWAVGRFGSTDLDSTMTWTTVSDTSADSLLSLRHLEIYNISLRAVDNAGNRSDTLGTDAPGILRLNSAPELAAVDSQLVDEDVQFAYQIIGTDIDTTTLLGDTLHYTLIDTAGILIPDTSFPLIIGESSGLIDWNTPLQADTGTYSFNVRVADEWGFSDTTGIVLTVGSVNDTPQVSLMPNVAFVEDIINGDTLSLHQYVTDVDNDTTEIIWVAVVMPDSTDYPNYPDPEFFFGPGSTPELERIIRNWVLKKRVKKEFTLFGKNGTFSQPAGDTTLAVIIDTLNNSTFAYFVADSNYYVDSREVIFVATDPDGAADSTNIEVTITALNDPPVMAVMLDTSMNENDTLILPLSAIDIDDSTVTFQVLSDTSAMTVSLSDTFATFIPDQFWVDSTDIIVIVSDEEYSDSTQFNLRVWRVPRPTLALSLGQNATFTHYFEFIVTDTAEKALDISLTIQQTGEQVALDTVGDFTWVGHHSFDTTKTYDFVMYGDAKVGDTTITRSAELALARANAGWIASSSDGKFQIISGAGAVDYDQPFMIVDSLLFPMHHNSGGLYRIGHPLLSFDEPVMITLNGDTTFAEEDQALYIRDEDDVWRELPTISKDGTLMSWTSEMGYFKIGRKTIFIPEHTSIQQNYPNPFNAQTHIIFDIGFFGGPDQKMNFIIYNLLGQEVYRIAKGNVEIGRHEFIWNGADNFGVPVSSGIYITRLTTNSGFSASMKMMLMK